MRGLPGSGGCTRPCKSALAHVADGERGDAGVGGLDGGEEDGLGDVGGVHHGGLGDGFGGAAAAQGELGFDAAGAENPDADAVGAEFGVEGLGEADLGKFCGAVDGFVGGSLEAGDGGDEEDDAGALPDHGRRGVAGEEEGRAEVGGDELVEVFGGGFDQRFVVALAGVVDEEVEAAEAFEAKVGGGDGGRF